MTSDIIKAYTKYDPDLSPAPPQYETMLRESLTKDWSQWWAKEMSKYTDTAAYGYGFDLYDISHGKVYRNQQFQPDLTPDVFSSPNTPYISLASGNYINPNEWRPDRTIKSTGNQYAFGYGYTAAVAGQPSTPFETIAHGTPARSIRTSFYRLGYDRGLADIQSEKDQQQQYLDMQERKRTLEATRREELALMSDYQGFKEAAQTYDALFSAYGEAVSEADKAAEQAVQQQRDWRDAALRTRGVKPPPRLQANQRSPAAEKDFKTYSDIALNSIWSRDFENSLVQAASAATQYREMERVRQDSVDRTLPFSDDYKNRLSEMFSWQPQQRTRLPEFNIKLPSSAEDTSTLSPIVQRRTKFSPVSVGQDEDTVLGAGSALGG